MTWRRNVIRFSSDVYTLSVKQSSENCIDFNFLPLYKGFMPISRYLKYLIIGYWILIDYNYNYWILKDFKSKVRTTC